MSRGTASRAHNKERESPHARIALAIQRRKEHTMSAPRTPRAPLEPERLRRVAAGIRIRVAQAGDRSARIGSYRACDGSEHEVVIAAVGEDWEVRDRGPGGERLVENLGGQLQDAVALAVEYRRDLEQRSINSRARLTAREALRLREALANNDGRPLMSGRRAA
jgi:hypothetical protein